MSKIDILKIAKSAQIAKSKNEHVIDATIGMFYNDDSKLIIPAVEKAYYDLDLLDAFKYGATDGGPMFVENVIDWVLDDKRKSVEEKFLIGALSTPGGSGAISLIFNTYGHVGDKVLVPNLRWRYEYFLNAAKLKVHEHNMFKGDGFDLEDFKTQLNYLTSIQKRVIVVINDPCHNPTGFSLSDKEWQSIIEILNSFDKNELILVYDIAYFDYDPKGFKNARNNFLAFKQLKPHVQVLTAFSASKSFAMYGVRLGGLLGLFHTKEQQAFFKVHVLEDALGKWSTSPSVGVGIFNKLATKKDEYVQYLITLTSTLKQRGEIFIKEALENNLDIYPYRGGFFVLVKSNNPEKDYEKLIDDNIYLIPMEKGLRVALCGITTKEVIGLAKRIKNVVGA
ncbi:pyridoxal phosphate-dependent aminotransferase [Acholeplasma laidlawii]|uniref:pyridoxal phosphate-dependent aminotransferase n=1 Tax=Acholeplasma laidlawii TaxID=2148 RepID=UPI00084C922B|nr:aminotransferase class I/II-fold pyridoxal phosphate-dependent enzyme [Acholeplasma laidlawii]NWH11026.1 aminotransferase class I/II-fold pyridoxal phosphate-dependent enzyme [Acholeplasma laidlawii]OED28087.1 hypothetical protein A9269_00960 [Acholeplasma laidlawii]OWU87266.1 hypothetical protein A8G01_04150 [Acholeplasma laidlawii]